MKKILSYCKNHTASIFRYVMIGIAVICLLITVISYIKPKYSYKSTAYHVTLADNEDTYPLSLAPGNIVIFNLDAGTAGLNGIQPCFYWGSDTRPDGTIIIDAYNADTYPAPDCYLGQARTQLDASLAEAFAYAEFSYDHALTGNLRFEIRYEAGTDATLSPFLIAASDANSSEDTSAALLYNTDPVPADPLLYYATVVKTYPLVFDARLLLCISIALLIVFPGKKDSAPARQIQKGFGIELPFFIVSMVLGMALIFLTGTNQISYDEQTHVSKTWNLSFGSEVYDTQAALAAKTLSIPTFHSWEERAEIEAQLDAQNSYESASVFGQTKFVTFEKRAYLPNAIFMALGRVLGMPFHIQLMFSKLGNLLLYSFVCALAIRLAKKGKAIVLAVSLLPTALFTASQFSYDPTVNCFLILYGALLSNVYFSKEKLTWQQTLLLLGSLIIGSYSKLVYALLGIPLLFISGDCFFSKKRAVIFRIVTAFIMLFLLLEIVAPSYGGTSIAARAASAGDDRIEGTSVLGQFSYMTSHLGSYLGLLFSSIGIRFVSWLNGSYAFLNFGYMGSASLLCTYAWFLIFLFASLMSPHTEARSMLSKKWYLTNLLTFLLMVCAVWSVLYMSFNPVGADYIGGVQDRYFIPLLLPAAFCFMNSRLHIRLSEANFQRIVLCAGTLLSLTCIITLAYLPFYG